MILSSGETRRRVARLDSCLNVRELRKEAEVAKQKGWFWLVLGHQPDLSLCRVQTRFTTSSCS
jgi:hypothetical protein